MTALKQPYQELFEYLINELNVIALLTQMHEIEAIINENHKQQIKDAYNQGYREGLQDCNCIPLGDVAKYSNAEDYYNQTFNKCINPKFTN
jgi:flagellar biosynthesis/type III secretory pathway protein FliH